ncbi:DUF4402 domain-containing protein [Aurantiacibacter rhizosphaerae]|uniref:DUF4402 domain-containing protein n=1 Tax=Aurantiacibacter rhizosphaerae TaxID=2691582 RepID=A0A844X889_9SPHN|nr:DUF4402 domain-containing protein [Aurantiacibacter rhizosphaerae]MWV26591.1 DUF4402 domain-containing protein [Aurantiacibacter rhizosphaerae]
MTKRFQSIASVAAFLGGIVGGSGAVLLPAVAAAKTPEVIVNAQSDLRFGTFMVFGSGSRNVSYTGNVTDVSLVALEGNPTGPARFTVSYDRGNESKHVLDIELEMVISTPPRVRDGGVEGQLSAFETDLANTGSLAPGQPIRVELRNCRTRVCSVSFSVGARLDVTRQFGGANLVIPIPVDVTVISAERQGR